MSASPTGPWSVEGLYRQLAAERAEHARAALQSQRQVHRMFADSAAALEQAAGALVHAASTFIAIDGRLPGLLAEQAGALLAVAARFEEAADVARTSRDG